MQKNHRWNYTILEYNTILVYYLIEIYIETYRKNRTIYMRFYFKLLNLWKKYKMWKCEKENTVSAVNSGDSLDFNPIKSGLKSSYFESLRPPSCKNKNKSVLYSTRNGTQLSFCPGNMITSKN